MLDFIFTYDVKQKNELRIKQIIDENPNNETLIKFLLQRGSHNGYYAIQANQNPYVDKYNETDLMDIMNANGLSDSIPYGGITAYFNSNKLHEIEGYEKSFFEINNKDNPNNLSFQEFLQSIQNNKFIIFGIDTCHSDDINNPEIAQQHNKQFVINEMIKFKNGLHQLKIMKNVTIPSHIKKKENLN